MSLKSRSVFIAALFFDWFAVEPDVAYEIAAQPCMRVTWQVIATKIGPAAGSSCKKTKFWVSVPSSSPFVGALGLSRKIFLRAFWFIKGVRRRKPQRSWGEYTVKSFIFAAVAVATISAPAFAADTTYNSTPASGFFYGAGNDYSPANAAVSALAGGNEIALRFHQTGQLAPASNGAVYNFALGTAPISFDWSLTSSARNVVNTTSITVMNVGTGQTVSYNPFFAGNDNSVSGGTVQNSARLNFGFLLGNTGFTPNTNSLYRVTLGSDFGPGLETLSIDAQIGAAVPEPASWALMLGGFGLAGAAMRRRQRVTVTYA